MRTSPARRAAAALVRLPLLVLVLVAVSALAWLVEVGAARDGAPAAADGIVVLTGGADRIATALRLLADGRGSILLVSGVGGSAPLADLLRRSGVDPVTRAHARAQLVTLGRTAASTYGNALETAEWARAHGLHSLMVVTAYYHMPRALLELSRALPDVSLYPVAVQPPQLHGFAQWRLFTAEYAKWVLAWAGLSRFAASRPVAGASHGPGPA